LALGFKNISTEIISIHLVKEGGEQFSEEYSKLNPMNQVPSLVLDDGRVLTQSVAIIEFLEEKFPLPSLFPSEKYERAKMRELVEIVNAGIQPSQNLSLLLRLEELQSGAKLAWGKEVITKGLHALEKKAIQTSGDFLIANQFTAADCCLIPQLYNARRFKCDLSQLPTLLRIEDNCKKLDFFAAATPGEQFDAQ
jgi:maleylacetoacetate isomerase